MLIGLLPGWHGQRYAFTRVLGVLCALLLFPLQSRGAPATNPSPTTILSIYSTSDPEHFDAAQMLQDGKVPGHAIIQQRRTLDLQEGENNFDLLDVAASADFSTFSLRPVTADAFKVTSQTLRERLTEPDSILKRAIGHEILINRKQSSPANFARAPETINAKLLAFDQHQLVIETNNRQLPIQIIPRNSDIAEIKLMADSAASTTRPAFACKIFSKETGPQEVLLTYQANKITWHADYEINLQEEQPTAHFTSAITIVNRTAATFEDASINLLQSASTIAYPIFKRATLPADTAQRISLFDLTRIPTRTLLAVGPRDYGKAPTTASTYLAIDNNSKNNLGLNLPTGRLRVMRKDLLVTDTAFPPSARDDLILIRIATSSLINASRKVEQRIDTDRPGIVIDSTHITLRNRDDHPQRIILIEPGLPPGGQILEKSDAFEKQSQSLLFTVDIPAGGEKIVTYSLRHPTP